MNKSKEKEVIYNKDGLMALIKNGIARKKERLSMDGDED